MATLSYVDRSHLPDSAFALPSRREGGRGGLPLTNARGQLDPKHIGNASARLSMMVHRGSVTRGEAARAHARIRAAACRVGMPKTCAGEVMDNPMGAADPVADFVVANPWLVVGMAAAGAVAAAGVAAWLYSTKSTTPATTTTTTTTSTSDGSTSKPTTTTTTTAPSSTTSSSSSSSTTTSSSSTWTPTTSTLGISLSDVQKLIDSTLAPTIEAASKASSFPLVLAGCKNVGVYNQQAITWLASMGADTTTLNSLNNTLMALQPSPTNTQAQAAAALVVAIRSLVEVQNFVYLGTKASAVSLTTPPTALALAAAGLLLAYASVGCSGLKSDPTAVVAFQIAYAWAVPGFAQSGVYDSATAAALAAMGKTPPAVCAAGTAGTGALPRALSMLIPGRS